MARRPTPLDQAVPPPSKGAALDAAPAAGVSRFAASPGPAASRRPPSRAGKRPVTFYLEPEAWRSLQLLSVDQDQTIQALMEQALDHLLRHHRRARATHME